MPVKRGRQLAPLIIAEAGGGGAESALYFTPPPSTWPLRGWVKVKKSGAVYPAAC